MEVYPKPCPHCAESGHEIIDWPDLLTLQIKIVNCPHLPPGTLVYLKGSVIRDNRALFRKKSEIKSNEFPEFSDELDFFDANSTIEV